MLKPYIVSALFGMPPDGKLCQNAILAVSPEAAAAVFVAGIVQAEKIEAPLVGIAVQLLSDQFIEAARRGGQPAEVVTLHEVPKVTPPCAACGRIDGQHEPQCSKLLELSMKTPCEGCGMFVGHAPDCAKVTPSVWPRLP